MQGHHMALQHSCHLAINIKVRIYNIISKMLRNFIYEKIVGKQVPLDGKSRAVLMRNSAEAEAETENI